MTTSPIAEILTHVDAGVLTLTINRLDRKNSITAAMYAAMADVLAAAEKDNAVRALVIQGHETIFSAGNDIGDFLNKPPSTGEAPVFRFLYGISAFTKPVVAAVCGPAVGIGTTMLLHCDLIYAGDNAAFSMPFVNLGLCPEAGSSLLVPQLMGYPRAAEALLLGEPFTAETALEIGLINRIVPPSEVSALAQQQGGEQGALQAAAAPQHFGVVGVALKAAVPAQVAAMAVAIALAIGLVVAQIAADQVAQREAVVRNDVVDGLSR